MCFSFGIGSYNRIKVFWISYVFYSIREITPLCDPNCEIGGYLMNLEKLTNEELLKSYERLAKVANITLNATKTLNIKKR